MILIINVDNLCILDRSYKPCQHKSCLKPWGLVCCLVRPRQRERAKNEAERERERGGVFPYVFVSHHATLVG